MEKKGLIWKIAIGVALVFVGVALVYTVVTMVFNLRVFNDFDAGKYVESVCVQTLQGNVDTVVQMTSDLSKEDAEKQHEEMVAYFLENIIASGLTLEKEEEEACLNISKKIFSAMKYEVKESKKVADGEYLVTISYQKTDVIDKLKKLAQKEYEQANEKVDKGEYRGTADEINAQIQKEFAEKLPKMLEEAYKTMEFGKSETMTVTVKENENGLYKVDISEFIIKIMGLSAKEH